MAKRKFDDARKFDNDDKVKFTYGDKELKGTVFAVRFREDHDGIRHFYEYIIDSPELPLDPDDHDHERHIQLVAQASELSLIKAA